MNKREIKEAMIEASQEIDRAKYWKGIRNRFLWLLIVIPLSVLAVIWTYHQFLG